MRRVLVAREKHCTRVFDISTPELSEKAYLSLFQERDKEDYYDEWQKVRSELWQEAKNGNAIIARRLIKFRSQCGYEYEYVEEINVE